MTNYKEILRLNSLGIKNTQIAASCGCSRTMVINTLQKAVEQKVTWQIATDLSNKEIYKHLFPKEGVKLAAYKMPNYEYVHHEMAKKGVALTLLWVEYCERCRESRETPYQSTQFNKYYSDFVKKTKATMHINKKSGEIMEVDWAGQTASIIDADTGERIPVYVFVAALPYSGYAYVEAFLSQQQENWIKRIQLLWRSHKNIGAGQLKNRY